MTYDAVKMKLNQLYLAEDYDGFIAFWQRTYPHLSRQEQLECVRKLTMEWQNQKLIRELLVNK